MRRSIRIKSIDKATSHRHDGSEVWFVKDDHARNERDLTEGLHGVPSTPVPAMTCLSREESQGIVILVCCLRRGWARSE